MSQPVQFRVEREPVATALTTEALACLADIRAAAEGDPVAIIGHVAVEGGLPGKIRTEIGGLHRDRILKTALDTLAPGELRMRAGYAAALVAEDRLVSRLAIWATRHMHPAGDEHRTMFAYLAPRGAVICLSLPDLSIHDAGDRDQQAFYDRSVRVVMAPDLSRHEGVATLARLERLAADIVTFGTVRRHMSLESEADHPVHPVRLKA